MLEYLPRIVDDELDELAQGLPAISLEGPKGVGKTATAQRRARTTFALDEPAVRELLAADPGRLTFLRDPCWSTSGNAIPPSMTPTSTTCTGYATTSDPTSSTPP